MRRLVVPVVVAIALAGGLLWAQGKMMPVPGDRVLWVEQPGQPPAILLKVEAIPSTARLCVEVPGSIVACRTMQEVANWIRSRDLR